MLGRSIPFYNMILRCGAPPAGPLLLPEGYRIRPYQPGDERAWARLEQETGDFPDQDQAEAYFVSRYCRDPAAARKRCLFAVDRRERVVGSCIAWQDPRGEGSVSSLHWLVVASAHQRRGLGSALCRRALQVYQELDAFPVYLHTQPWSYGALLLYVRLGFRLQRTDTFSGYENQYAQGMRTLRRILPAESYRLLADSAEP